MILWCLTAAGCTGGGASLPDGWEPVEVGRVSFGVPPNFTVTPEAASEGGLDFRATGPGDALKQLTTRPTEARDAQAVADLRQGERQVATPGYRGGPVREVEIDGAATGAVLEWSQQVEGERADGVDIVAVTEDGDAAILAYSARSESFDRETVDQLVDSISIGEGGP